MEKTILKMVVSAPDAPLTPDTGFTTSLGADAAQTSHTAIYIALGIVGALLAVLAIAMFIYRRHCIKNGYGLSSDKTSIMMRSFCLLAAFAVTGSVAGMAIGELGKADAATNFEPTTENTLTAEVQLVAGSPVTVCAVDTIRMNQALPAGYAIKMTAPDLALTTDANVKIASIRTAGQLSANTWGYSLPTAEGMGEAQPIPATSAEVISVEEATDSEEASKVAYCASFGPDAAVGIYQTEITYNILPNYVNYSLNYDANGGTLPDTIVEQVSDETIETPYTFTVTSETPTAPEGSTADFYGWSVTGDSTSEIYESGATIEVTDLETTLKAVWGYGMYTLTYDKNTDDEVTNFTSSAKCIITKEGEDTCDVAVTSRIPALPGSTLLGYSDTAYTQSENATIDEGRAAVNYLPGAILTMNANKTIFAVWWRVSNADYQMELRWGENPHDIDSYLTAVRNSDGAQIFTVYYRSKTQTIEGGSVTMEANLDIDDMSSYGPETVTLSLLPREAYADYTFYYYVRNYSGEERGLLKESDATVSMIKYDGTTKEYNVASAAGPSARFWNVFAIKNGQIVDRNTLTAEADLSY